MLVQLHFMLAKSAIYVMFPFKPPFSRFSSHVTDETMSGFMGMDQKTRHPHLFTSKESSPLCFAANLAAACDPVWGVP